MKHYDFQKTFRYLYEKALTQFAAGGRGAETFFDEADRALLQDCGLTAQHLYDYAEDQENYGEPGYDLALTIESVRHNYFSLVQQGQSSSTVLDEKSLPSKTESVKGIEWLPRIIPKAKAKLRGELPASLMYCCGGDRRFFKTHDINPAEFLQWVWLNEKNDAAIIDWVAQRSAASHAAR